MGDNVVGFAGFIPPQAPDPTMVEALEAALADAKAGNMVALGLVYNNSRGEIAHFRQWKLGFHGYLSTAITMLFAKHCASLTEEYR